MTAVEMNINMSGNPADLTDEEAEALLSLELTLFSKAVVRYAKTGE